MPVAHEFTWRYIHTSLFAFPGCLPTFAAPMLPTASTRPYTIGFWLMCLSSFLFFLSFNLLLPELPDHLTRLGGGEYKGYIIALFTLTVAISRPFSGKLADTVGRIPVMVFGWQCHGSGAADGVAPPLATRWNGPCNLRCTGRFGG